MKSPVPGQPEEHMSDRLERMNMNLMKNWKKAGLVCAVVMGTCVAVSSLGFAQDAAKKEAPAKKEAAAAKPKAPVVGAYAAWVKELGLDEAAQVKLAEINAKQAEFNKNFTATNGAKLAELDKAAKEDLAAGKKDDAKAKRDEIAKIREAQVKATADFRAQALAVLTPAQQKQLLVGQAQRTALSLNPFKSVNLTEAQTNTVKEKIAAGIDGLTTESKEIDRRKLNDMVKTLSDEVLTADQKAEVERLAAEAKAKAAAAKSAPAAK
jgi:Spy/CpxP family protein refolding chaperone